MISFIAPVEALRSYCACVHSFYYPILWRDQVRLDIRQEADQHAEAMAAITQYVGDGNYLDFDEEQRMEYLGKILSSRRPLIPRDVPCNERVGWNSQQRISALWSENACTASVRFPL